jgi:8-oxo-dGTP diphosphatase
MVSIAAPDRHLRAEAENLKETTLCLLMKGNPPEHVLLGLKKEGFGAGKITGFGGKVEPGETPAAAAIRELEEETGIKVTPDDLQAVGQLHFMFPELPAWSQLVHVFLSREWVGIPREGREMRPVWFAVDRIPFEQMWHDGYYWLPRFLDGERIRGRFVFGADNETVAEACLETWNDEGRARRERGFFEPACDAW